jgi:hypothetical protein
LGGAAAAKGQGALNALGMEFSGCGFGRVSSRPAMIIKGMKKAAFYQKIQHSLRSLARRLAFPLFLPAASSYHQVLTAVQLNKANAACAEADELELEKYKPI